MDDDAAAASFFVLMGAAGFSASSKGRCIGSQRYLDSALPFFQQSFLLPTGNLTFDHVDQEVIGFLTVPFIESSVSADVKIHKL